MHSNNTSNHTSGLVQHGDNDHEVTSRLRKTKKQKNPKRGPGVAELEKMLREQEKKEGEKLNGGASLSLVPSLPHTFPLRSSFISPSNSLAKNSTTTPSGSSRRGLPPPVPRFHDNGNAGRSKGGSQLGLRGVRGKGRSKEVLVRGVFVPDHELLPVAWQWDSCETKKGEEAPKENTDFSFPIIVSSGSDHTPMVPPPPPMVQKNPFHPSMMNMFPWSAISSVATPSRPSSSSAGLYRHVESPSSRKSCPDYTSTLPEQEKASTKFTMVDGKRSRPNFPVDNWLPPPPPHMAYQPSLIRPQVCRPDPPSWSTNNAVFNLTTPSRDPMPSSPLKQKGKTCVNDLRNPSGHGSALITSSYPATTLPSTQNFKENMEGLLQRPSSGSEPESSAHKKSNLLLQPDEDQRVAAEATLGIKNIEKCTEKTRELIDLNLKL
ncbi:hypothetical protein PTKIN_Ptkin18bG0115500 [Pterospermum kingtungense]